MKTLVLLDVDGTIVPTRYPWTTTGLRGLQEFNLVVPPYAPAKVRVRPCVIAALNSWREQGADIRWLSSWGWKARFLARSIGLPDFEVFYDPSPEEIFMYARSQRPWKWFAVRDAAEDVWETPVRVIWIDNEPASGQTRELEAHLTGMHANIAEVKLVRPLAEQGLSLKDLRKAATLLGVELPPLSRSSTSLTAGGRNAAR